MGLTTIGVHDRRHDPHAVDGEAVVGGTRRRARPRGTDRVGRSDRGGDLLRSASARSSCWPPSPAARATSSAGARCAAALTDAAAPLVADGRQARRPGDGGVDPDGRRPGRRGGHRGRSSPRPRTSPPPGGSRRRRRPAAGDYVRLLGFVVVYALIGTMVAVLVRSTPIALAIGLVWFGPFENVIGEGRAWADRWFPGLLLRSMLQPDKPGALSTGTGCATLAVYAAVCVGVIAVVMARPRRDELGPCAARAEPSRAGPRGRRTSTVAIPYVNAERQPRLRLRAGRRPTRLTPERGACRRPSSASSAAPTTDARRTSSPPKPQVCRPTVRRRRRRALRRPRTFRSAWRSTTSCGPAPIRVTDRQSNDCGGHARPTVTSDEGRTKVSTVRLRTLLRPCQLVTATASPPPRAPPPSRACRRDELVLRLSRYRGHLIG